MPRWRCCATRCRADTLDAAVVEDKSASHCWRAVAAAADAMLLPPDAFDAAIFAAAASYVTLALF